MVSSIDIRIEMNRLKAIFLNENNWQKFLNRHKGKIRPVVKKEVDKFLHCGDMSNGFRTFKCEACPHVKNIPIRCKGKFCPTCAVGEAQKWAEIQSNDMYRTIHRHVVFTMDEGLRSIFAGHYRQALLKGLMDEAARLMNDWFVKQGMTPGIVVALHTFGSRLEFNPHIHMLVTMGGVTPDGKWKTYDYFPYSRLRKQWQTVVLKLIRRTLSTRAKKIVQPLLQEAYANNPDGFYVNAPKRSHTDVKGLLAYIGRYMKRGPIALHRIIMFDEEVVTFSYQDKRDGEWKAETLPVDTFIGRLVRHIPDKQFKMIRHYGLYSRRIKTIMKKVVKTFQREAKKVLINAREMTKPKGWRERIKKSFDKDPLECSECGNVMVFRGIAVRKNNRLHVQFANNEEAKNYINREIDRIESKTYEYQKKEATRKAIEKHRTNWDKIEKDIRERDRQLYLSSVQGNRSDS